MHIQVAKLQDFSSEIINTIYIIIKTMLKTCHRRSYYYLFTKKYMYYLYIYMHSTFLVTVQDLTKCKNTAVIFTKRQLQRINKNVQVTQGLSNVVQVGWFITQLHQKTYNMFSRM